MLKPIDQFEDVIHSEDLVERIEFLEDQDTLTEEETDELKSLKAVESQASASPDWKYGESLIRESYFVEYIKEQIQECFEFGALGKNINEWPWRHMKMDWEAAAKEAESDYMTVDFNGVEYLIRA